MDVELQILKHLKRDPQPTVAIIELPKAASAKPTPDIVKLIVTYFLK